MLWLLVPVGKIYIKIIILLLEGRKGRSVCQWCAYKDKRVASVTSGCGSEEARSHPFL